MRCKDKEKLLDKLLTVDLDYLYDSHEKVYGGRAFISGVASKNFEAEEIEGSCRSFRNSKVKNPRIGKTYKVEWGDPLKFKGKFIGFLTEDELIGVLNDAGYNCRLTGAFSPYIVFSQGEEFIIVDSWITQIERNGWLW